LEEEGKEREAEIPAGRRKKLLTLKGGF